MMINNGWPFGLILLGVLAGAGILALFSVGFAIQRPFEAPGYRGGRRPRRPGGVERASDMVGPDRIVYTFADGIEELWTGMPILMWVVIIGVSIWVIVYLVLFWNEVV
jgi:hypothetical protein